jgi:small subunit ribosomal protein S18
MSEENKVRTEAAPAAAGHRPSADGRPARPFNPKKRFEPRRKVCKFCAEKIDHIDYKNIQLVKSFTMESGKILSRRITGTCAKHQRQVTQAVKRDRNLAFLPYSLPKK